MPSCSEGPSGTSGSSAPTAGSSWPSRPRTNRISSSRASSAVTTAARSCGNICSCPTKALRTPSSAARSTRGTRRWRSPLRRSSTSSAFLTRSSSSCSWSTTPGGSGARRCGGTRATATRSADVGFEEAHAVLACLAGLDGRRPKVAAAALATLVHRRGLERASEALMRWAPQPSNTRGRAADRENVSVAARTAERVLARRAALARVQPRTASILAGLVAGSFLLRTVLGWLRATPTFFADEYIYAELARSISETGRPLIRGVSASFPALLQPLLTAPAWLVEDVETSFRLVQTIGALVMSLAVVPVFLLARRLGIGTQLALVLAGLAVLVPDMVYAGWIVAEPFAYPLVLSAVAVGTVALARPRPRLQLAFLALAGLATFARIQFVVLPVCFLAATLVHGPPRTAPPRDLQGAGARRRPPASSPSSSCSRSDRAVRSASTRACSTSSWLSPEMTKWVGIDAMLLVYGSGVVLAPGALLGLWLALRRPRSREELRVRRARRDADRRPAASRRPRTASAATGSRSATSSTPSRSSASPSPSTRPVAGLTGSPTARSPPASSSSRPACRSRASPHADGKTDAPTSSRPGAAASRRSGTSRSRRSSSQWP